MEESIACKGPCKKSWAKFGRSSFLRHIKQAKKCREKYSDDEIKDIEDFNKQRTLDLNRKRNLKNYDQDIRSNKYRKVDNKDIELALESLWIDAKAKVDVKVADTKFLMLRDVLLSTNGEGKQNYFFQIISERVTLYNLTTLAQCFLKYQFYLNS